MCVEYRVINQNEKDKYIKNKLNILAIHERLSKWDLYKTQMNSDATISYPSAMYDKNSIHAKIETVSGFEHHMNDVFVNDINIKIFNQDGNDSAVLKIK